jgi:hypothetical protein
MRTLPSGFIAPCLPTKASTPPCGGLWLYEIKHDGYGGVLMTATRQLQGRGDSECESLKPFSGGGRSVEKFVQQFLERIFSRPPGRRRSVEID